MIVSEIIESLNKRPDIAAIRVSNLEPLSNEEQQIFRQYLPEQTLIVYGTLAPGKPNHDKLAHVSGVWESGTVKGKLESKGCGATWGFDGFKPVKAPEQSTEIPVHVLRSPMLIENWAALDDFEGTGYKRILAPYTLHHGVMGVGYIYAVND